jgi:hypothetical protein
MIEILLFCLVISFIFILSGSFFLKFFFSNSLISKNIDNNPFEKGLFGIIFISYLALFINFIYPLNKTVNTFILFIFLFYSFFYNYNKKFFLYLIILSLVASILVIYNNVNRPDAGSYHLPYINILNENKIIIGLSNIHFRFAHISIIQYLSATFNNFIFKENGTSLPLAIMSTFFLGYLIYEMYLLRKKKIINIIYYFFIFLTLSISLYNLSNYSEYGNDIPGYIFFFFCVILFLKIKDIKKISEEDFGKILTTSIFVSMNKIFLLLILIIPIYLLLISKKIKLLKSKIFYFSLFIFVLWLFKSFLISGCLVYPIKITCSENFYWTDIVEVKKESISGEAWAKGWIDQKNIIINQEEYIKDFNWFKTWSSKHLLKIFEKTLPIVILIVIFTFYLIRLKKKINYNIYWCIDSIHRTKIIFFICVLGSIIWFLKFPLYRYGHSYLHGLLIFVCLLFLKNINIKNINFNIRLNETVLFIFFIFFIIKNIHRIYNNFGDDYLYSPWPKIYSFSKNNEKIDPEPIFQSNKIIYYKSNEVCMYGYSPCTHTNANLQMKEIYGYKIFLKK